MTACFMALAIRIGSRAPAMAVFISTPSQPSSMAMVASDAAVAMELGCDGVLMNTAIAEAKNPILMAAAMKAAVEAGRLSYRAGRMGRRMYADPSSPLAGLI